MGTQSFIQFPINHQTQSYRLFAINSKGALEKILTHLPKFLKSQADMDWGRQRQQLRKLLRPLSCYQPFLPFLALGTIPSLVETLPIPL